MSVTRSEAKRRNLIFRTGFEGSGGSFHGRTLLSCLVSLLLACVWGTTASATTYRLTALGDLPGGNFRSWANSINESGQVVGAGHSANSLDFYDTEAFLWDPVTGIRALGDLPGGRFDSRAQAINDSGQVVGWSHSSKSLGVNDTEAFIWDAVNGMRGLGDFAGGRFSSSAEDINGAGKIVGIGNSEYGNQGFMWDSVYGIRTLGGLLGGGFYSRALGMNEPGQVTGETSSQFGLEAYFWDPVKGITLIGDLAGGPAGNEFYSVGTGVNDMGQVVGYSRSSNTVTSTSDHEAFIWDPITDMTALEDLPGGRYHSRAHGINNFGQVVGVSSGPAGLEAFIWDPVHKMVSLKGLLDASGTGWTLVIAYDINNKGQIVGEGRNPSGQTEAFLITPIPDATDSDGDRVADYQDNCPFIDNARQTDCDSDGFGNECDLVSPCSTDTDGDGIMDDVDNCLNKPNANQADCDSNGIGDACDLYSPCGDVDGDGLANGVDNCKQVVNPGQADCDGNGMGDLCDLTSPCVDRDSDGLVNANDNCTTRANPDQADCDGDGIGDACDPDMKGCAFDWMVGLFSIEAGSDFLMYGGYGGSPLIGGTDGGLLTGQFQPDAPPTSPSGDVTGAGAIIDPSVFTFFGFTVHVSTNQRDPWTGEIHPAPWVINNGDGTLTANLSAWDVLWTGTGGHYNQGAPKYAAGGSLLNPAPVGTYDPGTGIYSLTWESLIFDGPFDGGLGYWHLTGRFNETVVVVPTGDVNGDGKVDVADAMLAQKIASGAWVPDAASAFHADVEPYMSGGAPDGVMGIRDVLRICRMAGMGI